jgi:Domain of unknown function (DUF927)
MTASASDVKALSAAIARATKAKAPKHYVYETRTGWIRKGRAFVLQGTLVGRSSDKIIGIAPIAEVGRGRTRMHGTSEEWTNSVGQLAKDSSTMMLAIATALAGPMLRVMNEDTFGICWFGPSRGGKTLVTLSAGSVIGFGEDEQMLNWFSTTAGLEPHFRAFNDCVFPIDDLSKLPVKSEHERYLEVRKLAYQAIGGDIKGRHPSFASAPGTNGAHYRFIVLTSFEKSIQELAQEANQARMGGETIRLIDTPAYFDGLVHVFDRAHARAALTQEELQKLFARVRSACAANHGYVYRRYLGSLIAQRLKLKKTGLKYQRSFITRVSRSGDNTDAADLARKFGLIYAGGRMGIEAKVLPWKRMDLFDAIQKCYRAARDLLPDEGVILESGRKALLNYCKSLPAKKEISTTDCGSLDGFRMYEKGYHRCLVKCDKFNSIFETTSQAKLVTGWLIADKRVSLKRLSAGSPKMKDQHIWPDGQRHRSLEIFWGDERPLLRP